MIDRKKKVKAENRNLRIVSKKWQTEYKLLGTRAVKHNSVSEKRCKI